MKMGMRTRTIYQCIEKKMTNGDKIRKMSDDELAETIACPYYDGPEMCFKETIRNELTYFCTRKAVFQGVVETYKSIYPEIFAELRKKYDGACDYM